jgi:hypothetical protein
MPETLKDAMPHEFMGVEHADCAARKYADVVVVQQFVYHDKANWKPWPGTHQNVYQWVKLANGLCVGFNENPARGWSFPVTKYRVKINRGI